MGRNYVPSDTEGGDDLCGHITPIFLRVSSKVQLSNFTTKISHLKDGTVEKIVGDRFQAKLKLKNRLEN